MQLASPRIENGPHVWFIGLPLVGAALSYLEPLQAQAWSGYPLATYMTAGAVAVVVTGLALRAHRIEAVAAGFAAGVATLVAAWLPLFLLFLLVGPGS